MNNKIKMIKVKILLNKNKIKNNLLNQIMTLKINKINNNNNKAKNNKVKVKNNKTQILTNNSKTNKTSVFMVNNLTNKIKICKTMEINSINNNLNNSKNKLVVLEDNKIKKVKKIKKGIKTNNKMNNLIKQTIIFKIILIILDKYNYKMLNNRKKRLKLFEHN
jgi:hypothetical protein